MHQNYPKLFEFRKHFETKDARNGLGWHTKCKTNFILVLFVGHVQYVQFFRVFSLWISFSSCYLFFTSLMCFFFGSFPFSIVYSLMFFFSDLFLPSVCALIFSSSSSFFITVFSPFLLSFFFLQGILSLSLSFFSSLVLFFLLLWILFFPYSNIPYFSIFFWRIVCLLLFVFFIGIFSFLPQSLRFSFSSCLILFFLLFFPHPLLSFPPHSFFSPSVSSLYFFLHNDCASLTLLSHSLFLHWSFYTTKLVTLGWRNIFKEGLFTVYILIALYRVRPFVFYVTSFVLQPWTTLIHWKNMKNPGSWNKKYMFLKVSRP